MLNVLHRTITNPGEGLASSSYITFAATTAMLNYSPSRPIRVVRWGIIVTTEAADDASAALKFTCDLWATAGTSTSATTGSTTSVSSQSGYNASNSPAFYYDTAGGSMTIPNSVLTGSGGLAAGSVVWHNVSPQAPQSTGYYPNPDTSFTPPGGVDTQFVIYPGQAVQVTCQTVGATAGAGKIFLEVEELAFQADYNNNADVVSGYPNTNGTTPTPSWPFAHSVYNYQS